MPHPIETPTKGGKKEKEKDVKKKEKNDALQKKPMKIIKHDNSGLSLISRRLW